MILKVIFQLDERSVKGGWTVLLRGTRACCGHTGSSLAAVWFSGSCLALSFSAGAVLVTPKCCPLSQGCLLSRAHQGHCSNCCKMLHPWNATCLCPNGQS